MGSLFVPQQEERREVDPWEAPICRYLRKEVPEEIDRKTGRGVERVPGYVTTETLMRDVLDLNTDRHDALAQKRVAQIMHLLGWESARVRHNDSRFRAWIRTASADGPSPESEDPNESGAVPVVVDYDSEIRLPGGERVRLVRVAPEHLVALLRVEWNRPSLRLDAASVTYENTVSAVDPLPGGVPDVTAIRAASVGAPKMAVITHEVPPRRGYPSVRRFRKAWERTSPREIGRGRRHPESVRVPVDSDGMHPNVSPSGAPWNEVLRASVSGDLHWCVFGMRVCLKRDRHEPRNVGLALNSGRRSLDIQPVYICPCGAFVLGEPSERIIDNISTETGAAVCLDSLAGSMRQLRVELAQVAAPLLRTVAMEIHADLVRQLAVHATRWNIPPFALLGRTRARPAECLHRRA
jgi:hypothetical protein